MNWSIVSARAPKAVKVFEDWARTKSVVLGWHKDMKAEPSTGTAFTLLIGPLIMFFREQDIVFSYHVTKLGRMVVLTHRPDRLGHYKCVARTISRVDPVIGLAYAFSKGFDYLEARINGHEEIPSQTETVLVEE